jgi:hypothetical protein
VKPKWEEKIYITQAPGKPLIAAVPGCLLALFVVFIFQWRIITHFSLASSIGSYSI